MDKIPSFQVNHIDLLRGIYTSRQDQFGPTTITTFDIRMKEPNREPVMNTAEIHAMEHLGATFLRNHDYYKEKIVYFGPMGCRTGFYLVVQGDYSSNDIYPLIVELFRFIIKFEGIIPGASARDCGNYRDMNLEMAKYEAYKYYEEVLFKITDNNLIYPI